MSQTAYWAFALLLSAATSAQADGAAASVELSPCQFDDDGLSRPLDQLKFDPGLGQREFGRATLDALNVYDPWESWNHRVYHFNYRFDGRVPLPVVRGYEYATSHFACSGVSNFFDNLDGVPNLLNNLVQLKNKVAMETTVRLLFNTTFGVPGLWDPATEMGLHKCSEDFGQTLGFHGVGGGPYLMLSILGPSNLRDTGGPVVDYVGEYQVDYLNVPQASGDHPEIAVLCVVGRRYNINFRYGQMNSPFECEKLRYIYTEARKLQTAE